MAIWGGGAYQPPCSQLSPGPSAVTAPCPLPAWQLVPTACPGLGAGLPAVARQSHAEAGQPVRRLLPAERHCLRGSCLSHFLPASLCAAILVHVV